jgi:hypothetical protein
MLFNPEDGSSVFLSYILMDNDGPEIQTLSYNSYIF